ncbi:hypothetical protein SmJEL517_g01737 [Synchytrium microbalum]|uniref:Cyclin-like domain-containing protein n=1 Tax=Synchytrium microbalum TaxID=1806994 RepID=A0A507C9L7_9FUNG|nr:uncharacterized protein SmJEL517_g01737 [Synchytrium microbalum]TPX35859.1 hypothetical protein SmJEL517_g01737 [Synchytrium microbalum]
MQQLGPPYQGPPPSHTPALIPTPRPLPSASHSPHKTFQRISTSNASNYPNNPATQSHNKNANEWSNFTDNEMYWTPTRMKSEDSKEAKEEANFRFRGTTLIFSVGIVYNAPQELIATAQTLYHRFYMKQCLQNTNYFEIAATALWVAWKVDFDASAVPKIGDYIVVVARKAERNDNLTLEPNSKEWNIWKHRILFNEQIFCEALSWDLYVELPYTYVFDFGNRLGVKREVGERAIGIVSDSCRLPLLLQYHPKEVAIAALYIACALIKEELRVDVWEMSQVKLPRVTEIVREITQLYMTRSLFKGSQSGTPTTPNTLLPTSVPH